jgi:hypothetical protein
MSTPTWRNPGGALYRVIQIAADQPLPLVCPECNADRPAWLDRGEHRHVYPRRTFHRFMCPRCKFLIVERAVPDEHRFNGKDSEP